MIKLTTSIKHAIFLLAALATMVHAPLAFTTTPHRASSASVAAQPDISVNGFLSTDKAQRGTTVQAAVVMEIPDGYHVNSNRPLGKFAIPTTVKVEAPGGVRVGPVTYPRAVVRKFQFSEERLAVYEGNSVMRFNVTVPANFQSGDAQLRVRVRYQSCNDEACFQPVTRDVTIPLNVVGANESVRRINNQYFGARRRGR